MRPIKGKTITLKVKYNDFKQVTRSVTLDDYTDDGMLIYSTARTLLKKTETAKQPVRLLGVSMSRLAEEGAANQLSLFLENEKKETE